jgi:nickel-dependent lactate racemase
MKSNKVRLPYGRQGISVSLPAGCTPHEIHRQPATPLSEPDEAVRHAFDNPVGCQPLRELARGCRNACILVCDITRPVPNGRLLPHAVSELEAAGIARSHITILIATGLHRPAPEEEKRFIVGDEAVYGSVRIENHIAQDDTLHTRLGTTSRGTPVLLDRRFVDAEARVVIGLIEPHLMAGYSGGRKLIVPGVAHRDTIMAFHSPDFMDHPRSTNCIMDGNPLCEDQLEIVKMLDGEVFGVHITIDEERRPISVTTGALVEGHHEAVVAARVLSEVRVPRKFSTILTSAGGFPLDKTYYQTIKGMCAPLDILHPRGRIIIVSECAEGLGSPEFVQAQELLHTLGPEGFFERISQKSFSGIIDQWQTQKLAQVLRQAEVSLYTPSLEEKDWPLTCVEKAESLEAALMESMERGGDGNVAVIPDGPYVIPFHRAK